MTNVRVYFTEGGAQEDSVTNAFADPAFSIYMAEVSPDQTNGDLVLRDVLGLTRKETPPPEIVFIQKLTEDGKDRAREFAAKILADREKYMMELGGSFSAVAIPASRLESIYDNLGLGMKIFTRGSQLGCLDLCHALNQNMTTALVLIAVAALFIIATKTKTPLGKFLLILAAFLLFVWVVSHAT